MLLLVRTLILSKEKWVRISEVQSNSLTEATGNDNTTKISHPHIQIRRQEGHKMASRTHDAQIVLTKASKKFLQSL